MFAKKMHPDSDCLVVSHVDGRGKKPHNHILVINHNNRTGKALSDYRTFHDRKAGNQRGVQSANDQLMREHGLSVVKRLEHAPKDWELRREDFAEGSLDREMGDRMSAALADPRAVDKAGLVSVIEEQNQRFGLLLRITVAEMACNQGQHVVLRFDTREIQSVCQFFKADKRFHPVFFMSDGFNPLRPLHHIVKTVIAEHVFAHWAGKHQVDNAQKSIGHLK